MARSHTPPCYMSGEGCSAATLALLCFTDCSPLVAVLLWHPWSSEGTEWNPVICMTECIWVLLYHLVIMCPPLHLTIFKKCLWQDAPSFDILYYNLFCTLCAFSLFYRVWKQISLPQVYTNITQEKGCPILLVIPIASYKRESQSCCIGRAEKMIPSDHITYLISI